MKSNQNQPNPFLKTQDFITVESRETQRNNIPSKISKVRERSKSLTPIPISTTSAYSEILSKLMDESKCKCKRKSKKNPNPKEISWDSIDPNSSAAATLNLTRDIAGFFCATLSNMGEQVMLEEYFNDLLNYMEDKLNKD